MFKTRTGLHQLAEKGETLFEKSVTPVAQRKAHPAAHQAGNSSARTQAVTIRSVTTRRDRALFIKLPRLLYQGMASYTPPLDIEQRDLLDPGRAPIFRHASVRYFLAWRGARPVGRIAAIVDYVATARWEERIGLFGALDAEADESVIHALLDAARAWLRENGMVRMRGPVTLNCHGESGVMVSGQDEAPMIATPWHPPHLYHMMEQIGLKKEMDLLTFRLDLKQDYDFSSLFPQGFAPGTSRYEDIAISRLSKRQIAAQGEVLRALYNDAWAGTYNFVPMQAHEMRTMIKALRPVLRPEHYVQIDQNGAPVAMALVVPNIFDLTRDIGPQPSPLGWVKLAGRIMTHRCESARVILLGVSHLVRGTMLGALLPPLAISELLSRRNKLPYRYVELGWILETNTPMLNLVERFVAQPNKIHRIYAESLTGLPQT